MTIEEYVKTLKCPRCSDTLYYRPSCCYDNDCCGIADTIECYGCYWDVEGYWYDNQEDAKDSFERAKSR